MYPRKRLENWQNSAQLRFASQIPFACAGTIGEAGDTAEDRMAFAPADEECSPTLSMRLALRGDRSPFWVAGASATFRAGRNFRFSTPSNPLRKRTRIQSGRACLAFQSTTKRGRPSCSNPSLRWPFLWSLQAATVRSIPIAPDLARLGVAFSGRSPTTIWRKAPSQAAFWVPSRQIRACAAKAAGQPNRLNTDIKAIRGNPRVAFCVARPAEGGASLIWGSEACSRRS